MNDAAENDSAGLSKERQILRAMRKTLTSIVRDVAPRDGNASPFSTETVENIRMCLGLISAREAELAAMSGVPRNERPHYSDEPQAVQSIEFMSTTVKKLD